ncbi:mRNA 3' end processing factor [Nothophoma quercina]|uniref:mRNA 3' end processing factor n=1 Tax=Nothophoma quercina TaxID=749835 RepID=A0ABR3RTA4_9PLEO
MSLPAAEVAADFRDALQDLRQNSRPEISNLTLIAKENTEYAQAISTELENHIRSTRPEWKLPSLYVLDSIVKNVGTPYTVYLGRNLYRTFMDAYLVVDQGTRKALEGLLRTWKQPVAESMDTRPVFPANVTGDIENAVNKIRTVAAQTQVPRPMHALPARPPSNVAWRDTSTPPQNLPRYPAPNDPRRPAGLPPTPQFGAPVPAANSPFSPQQQINSPQPMSSVDLAELKAEVAQLVTTTQTSFAHNPADRDIQTKLQALLSLKQILDTQTLPPQQLEAVRKQVQSLRPTPTPMPTFAPPTPVQSFPPHGMSPGFPPVGAPPSSAPPNIAQLLAGFRPPVQSTPQPAPTPQPPMLNLADLLKRVSSPAQSSSIPAPAPFQPPPFAGFPPPISTPVPAPAATASPAAANPTANLAALLAQFSKPGAVPPPVPMTPVQPVPTPQLPQQPVTGPAPGSAEWLLAALGGVSGGTPSNGTPLAAQPMARQISAPTNVLNDIELTTASMKKPRLYLISRLYEAKPNICATCGRRFESTPEGKEKKARHMDWHFKVKDPDAAKRGVHRSWYMSEKDWIDYREVDETTPANDTTSANAAAKPKKQAKDRYVLVPQDVTLQHAPCPICQEKFETQWNVDANDFVWMDALQVGGKIYHATCFEEYSKGAGIPMPSTPDSVLGKRKAESGVGVEGKKVRAF